LPQFAGIALVKTGVFQDENGDGYADVGETISYSFMVSNTGNVTLTDVTLTDAVGGVTISGGPIPVLAVGTVDSTTFTGSYTITQADIDAGTFYNLATVTGTPPVGPPVSDNDDHDQLLPQFAGIALVKTGVFQDENGDGYADVGETISYSFMVSNTGNVTLTDVTLTDAVGGVTISGGPIPVLAVGTVDSTTFTGSYTITQADIDAGTFYNLATVTGTPPVGPPVSDNDDHDQLLPQFAGIALVKTGGFQDENGDGYADVGETISYSFMVSNTGNVTLTDVTLTDAVGGVTISGGPIPVLAVGTVDSTTFTGSYTITQADIDAGTFYNLATVTGTPPVGPPVSDNDDHDEPLPQFAGIALVKTGMFQDENGDGYADVGETISYSFMVSNTGNVTLTDVTLTDAVGGVTISGGPIPVLAVGAVDSTTFTGSYTITQADVDAGTFYNLATVTGTPPVGPPVSDNDDHDEPLPQFPGIALVKTGMFQDENGDGYADVGETISYSFMVSNTGNVTLTDVTLTDAVGGVTISGGPIPVLAVGTVDSTTFTGSYTITQADIDAGTFYNLATVTGTPPVGPPVSDNDDHDQLLPQFAGIALVKTGVFQDENGDGYADVGETISYSFMVSNTGNVTLTDVTLTDAVGGVTISGGPIPVLAVGAVDSTTFTGSYTITQADIDAGTFYNLATVTGTPPVGPPVGDNDDHDQPLPQNPDINIEKATNGMDADEPTGPVILVGGTVIWTYVVTNTGNVSLTNVAVTDDVLGLIGTIGLLAPGASQSFSAIGTAVVGQYTNIGMAMGTTPVGAQINAMDASNYFGAAPAIYIEKLTNGEDADEAPGPAILVDNTVTWTYVITNTGNVLLADIVVTDDILGPIGTINSLAPSASQTLIATGTAQVGQYTNLGSVTGIPPLGPLVTAEDRSHYFGVNALVDIEKYTNGEDADDAPGPFIPVGAPVTWTYVVSNTGNVDLTDVVVRDDKLGEIGVIGFFPAGASKTFSAIGTAEAGQYVNVGTATGIPPIGPPVTAEDPSNYFGAAPSISLQKFTNGEDADEAPGLKVLAGDPVTWTFVVTNTGNVELVNVAVTDDQEGLIASNFALAPGASRTFSRDGEAFLGQYTNLGAAMGHPPVGPPVVAINPSNYFGVAAEIRIVKMTNGTNNNEPTGPRIPVNNTVTWTYHVTNLGSVPLRDVVVRDDNGTPLDPTDDFYPVYVSGDENGNGLLDPCETWVFTATGIAQLGQYSNWEPSLHSMTPT
jgi:hypothetical protein